MDPRRHLTLTACCLALQSPQKLARAEPALATNAGDATTPAPRPDPMPESAPRTVFVGMAPIPNPPRAAQVPPGRPAIAAANASARARSVASGFQDGVQVFAYAPGRIYEVWTAPLRVTTLTLAPEETVISKAAGDTVRWQIGETTSGAGPDQRTHVMLKPLREGLETNLVLTTNQRLYQLHLRSGAPPAFNAAIAWSLDAAGTSRKPAGVDEPVAEPPPSAPTPTLLPEAAAGLEGSYRIKAPVRPPAWTPRAVLTDGVRTYLVFPPGLAASEAPALLAIGAGGERQLVNYRQQGGLWVVDRVLDRAELRLGDRRPQVVRIQRREVTP